MPRVKRRRTRSFPQDIYPFQSAPVQRQKTSSYAAVIQEGVGLCAQFVDCPGQLFSHCAKQDVVLNGPLV